MRIHSDKLTPELIRKCITEDPRFEGTGAAIWKLDEHGSRSRKRAFEVRAGADAGRDFNGFKRRPAMGQPANPDKYSPYPHPYEHTHAENYTEKAMSHAEWGFFIANMFAIDPEAKIGNYDGDVDFVRQTWGPSKFTTSGVEWSCAKYNGYKPWEACDWAFSYTPDDAPVGV